MSFVYHGSHTSGLKKLVPHKSTHGNYVYATEDKALPVIFSGVAGDDLVYSLFRENKGSWQLVERVPECFSVIYNTSASVYTLESDSFKDIHTGFTEVVSETAVNVVQEEKVPNVYQELERLEKEGLIQIYHYPKRSESIPKDDLDLLERTIEYTKMKIFQNTNFERKYCFILFLRQQFFFGCRLLCIYFNKSRILPFK